MYHCLLGALLRGTDGITHSVTHSGALGVTDGCAQCNANGCTNVTNGFTFRGAECCAVAGANIPDCSTV